MWSQIEDSLTAAWERISGAAPGIKHAETVHVVVVLGDPDDEHLTVRSAGYFGVGGIPGAIQLMMWPTDTSLEKIGHGAAHELHHNVRYLNVVWNPVAVTVGNTSSPRAWPKRSCGSRPVSRPWGRGRRR